MCSKGSPRRRSTRGCSTHARRTIFGAETPFYGWHYPPFFLLVAAALALLPYLLALIVWQGAARRCCSICWSIRAIIGAALSPDGLRPRRPLPMGRGARAVAPPRARLPAVFVNLGHGHNGFRPAALLGFATGAARIPAGSCSACSPTSRSSAADPAGACRDRPLAHRRGARVALAVRRRRVRHRHLARILRLRRIHARSCSNRRDRLAQDPERVLLRSRMWGAHDPARLSRRRARSRSPSRRRWSGCGARTAAFALKAAALCLATLLATPYSLDYDLMVLAPAIAFLAVDGLGAALRLTRTPRSRRSGSCR